MICCGQFFIKVCCSPRMALTASRALRWPWRAVLGESGHEFVTCKMETGTRSVVPSSYCGRIDLPEALVPWRNFGLLSYGKVYRICMADHILGIDLACMSLFFIMILWADFLCQIVNELIGICRSFTYNLHQSVGSHITFKFYCFPV